MRLVVELDLVIKAVLTHLEPGKCRLSGDLFTGRYVGNGSIASVRSAKLNTRLRSTFEQPPEGCDVLPHPAQAFVVLSGLRLLSGNPLQTVAAAVVVVPLRADHHRTARYWVRKVAPPIGWCVGRSVVGYYLHAVVVPIRRARLRCFLLVLFVGAICGQARRV